MRRFSGVARPAIIVLLLVIMALCVSGCAGHGKDDGSTPVPGDNAEPVPPAYQQLYRQLEVDMEDYKAAASVAANDGIFKRDAYSFWAPLDQQFLALMDRSARVNGIEYVSPFWANFFFAYADYDPPMERMSYAGVVAQANSAAAKNIVAGRYSGTGEYYRQLINEGR